MLNVLVTLRSDYNCYLTSIRLRFDGRSITHRTSQVHSDVTHQWLLWQLPHYPIYLLCLRLHRAEALSDAFV